MKTCPQCNTRYNDDELIYCLSDGAPLTQVYDSGISSSAPTVAIQPQTVTTKEKGSNVFLLVATIVLSLIVVVGATFFISGYFWTGAKIGESKEARALPADKQTPDQSDAGTPKAGQQSASVPERPAIPEDFGKPPANSKIFGLKRYGGNIGNEKAIFDLSWGRSATILGNFYYSNDPTVLYDVSGSNFAQGKASLEVRIDSGYVGKMTLRKTLEGKILC